MLQDIEMNMLVSGGDSIATNTSVLNIAKISVGHKENDTYWKTGLFESIEHNLTFWWRNSSQRENACGDIYVDHNKIHIRDY